MKVIISMLLVLYSLVAVIVTQPAESKDLEVGTETVEFHAPDALPSIPSILESKSDPRGYTKDAGKCLTVNYEIYSTQESSEEETTARKVQAAATCWLWLNSEDFDKPFCWNNDFRVMLFIVDATPLQAYSKGMCTLKW